MKGLGVSENVSRNTGSGYTDKNEPLISVIIPVFNVERYLGWCLDSVINQTYANLEIILVNDGSTDASESIARHYAGQDRRIRLYTQANAGVSAARNAGIRQARGEYIGFVDADDWIHPQMFAHLYKIIEAYDAQLSTVEIVCRKDEAIDKPVKNAAVRPFSRDEYMKRFFKIDSQETVYYTNNKLFRREIVEDELFPNFRIGEDVVSTFKALTHCKTIVTSSAPYYYYRQGSGITKSFNPCFFQLTDVWDEVFRINRQRKLCYEDSIKINQARILFTLLSDMAISGAYREKQYEEKKKRLISGLKQNRRFLLGSSIATSRKIMIRIFCFNYEIPAFLMHAFVRRRQ